MPPRRWRGARANDRREASLRILERHLQTCLRCRRLLERVQQLDQGPDNPGDWPSDTAVIYASLPSPLGTLWVAAGTGGVLAAEYAVEELSFCHSIERRGHPSPWRVLLNQDARRHPARERLSRAASQLQAYFARRRENITVPVDLTGCQPFQVSVLRAVRRIPYGETRTYGQLAEDVGHPRAARAVGSAIAKNPIAILLPCHRVVRADGLPGEYGMQTLGPCGVYYKQALLDLERS